MGVMGRNRKPPRSRVIVGRRFVPTAPRTSRSARIRRRLRVLRVLSLKVKCSRRVGGQDGRPTISESTEHSAQSTPPSTLTTTFTAKQKWGGKELGFGEGRSKKEAETAAARDALAKALWEVKSGRGNGHSGGAEAGESNSQ